MPSTYQPTVVGAPEDKNPGEPTKTDKPYVDIIRSDINDLDPAYYSETGKPTTIYFYSPEHKKLIRKIKRVGKKMEFVSDEEDTKGAPLAFGTKNSLMNYYKIPEEAFEALKKDPGDNPLTPTEPPKK